MGGHIQGRLWPRNDQEREAAIARGYDLDKVLLMVGWRRSGKAVGAVRGEDSGEVAKRKQARAQNEEQGINPNSLNRC